MVWVANAYNGNNGAADNHDQIYGRGALAPRGFLLPIYDSVPRLDAALGSLIEDLSKMPGKEPGKTMLDETMVVVGHEFGRTPDMNLNFGRDHWGDRKSTRLNSSHTVISYAVFCLKKK